MKHLKCYLFLLLAAPILNGCGLYTRYSRPDLDFSPDSLYRSSAVRTDSLGIVSKPWRELFADTCLQTLISKALQRNADLEIARLQVEEARAVLQNARLCYLPSIKLTPQESISSYSGETKSVYDIGAAASWEMDIFGRVTNAKREALASFEQSSAYVQAVQTQLVATVAESYYTLLMLDEQLEISNETLANWTETIAALEALVQAGKSNDVAVRQARANRSALEASILGISKSISDTENAISALLKEPAHTIERGTLGSQQFPDDVSVGIPVQLLSGRPDVREAEAELAEAFYATNSARAAFYPSLTLSGSLGWTNSANGLSVDPGAFLSSAMASLVAPLFNMGTNIANLKVAEARQQEAVLRFEQSLLDAGNEVNNALSGWQTADARIRYDEERVTDLEIAADKTELLVRYSSSTYLEVLSAQQALLDARLALAQDRVEKIQAIISLYHALGGGVK